MWVLILFYVLHADEPSDYPEESFDEVVQEQPLNLSQPQYITTTRPSLVTICQFGEYNQLVCTEL